MINNIELNLLYSIPLILSNGKKTCEEIAKFNNKSDDTILRYVKNNKINAEKLILIAKELFKNKKVYLGSVDFLF